MVNGQAPYQNIVVGTDGSLSAQEAVRHAAAISKAFGAKLHVVTAAIGREAEGPEDLLARVVGDLEQEGIDVAAHARTDFNPADAILAVAQEQKADLVVVGNRGMTGMSRVLGSVPNTISHHAECSVSIIRTT